MTTIDVRFKGPDFPRWAVRPPYELVGAFLDMEIGTSLRTAEMWLGFVRELLEGKHRGEPWTGGMFSLWGDAENVTMLHEKAEDRQMLIPTRALFDAFVKARDELARQRRAAK